MKPNFYAVIPASIRYDKGLSSSAKLFYGEITAMSNHNGYCWASNSYFSEIFGVSNSTISLWIKQLSDLGHVEVEYDRKGKSIVSRRIYPIQNIERTYSENLKKVFRKSKEGYSENLKGNTTSNNTTSNNSNRAKRFSPPSIDEVNQYCKERSNNIDAEYFIDFYQSKNWMVGKNKMKDWRAAIRTWEKKEKSSAKKESNYGKQTELTADEWKESRLRQLRGE